MNEGIGWGTEKLKNLPLQIIDGDRSSRYPKRDDFQNSGIPFINAGNIADSRVDFNDVRFISREKYEELSKGHVQHLDIVMTTRGTVGRVALFTEGEYDTAFINAQMLIIRADDKSIDPRFLFYALCGDQFQQSVRSNISGSAQPQLPIRDLREIEVVYPPLPVQRRIAGILGALDDKIEVNRHINRTLEEMAQTLYKHWFVDFRPFQAGEFVDSELGEVPAGWRIATVEDLMELAYGKGLPKRKRTPGPYPVFGSSGQIDTHEDYLVEGPGIIVGRKGTIGKLSRAQDNFWPIDTTYYVVPKREAYSLEFLYHVLAGLDLEKRNSDSAVPGLNRNDTYRLPVIVPPDEVLARFDKIVKPWFKQIEVNNRETQVLAEARDYLLPRLLSGEVEVPAAEAVVEGRRAGSEVSGYEQPALF